MKRDKEHTSKLAPRYEPAVFLGYNRNSTYRVGVWRGEEFHAQENKTVKFVKNDTVLVSDLKDLKPGGSQSTMGCLDLLCDSVMPEDEVISRGFGHPAGVGSETNGSPSSEKSTCSSGPNTTNEDKAQSAPVKVTDSPVLDDPTSVGDDKAQRSLPNVTSSGGAPSESARL